MIDPSDPCFASNRWYFPTVKTQFDEVGVPPTGPNPCVELDKSNKHGPAPSPGGQVDKHCPAPSPGGQIDKHGPAPSPGGQD